MLFFFSAASYPYIFRNSPCRKNAPLFSANHQSENPFSPFLLCYNFYSFLMNMPITYIEEIETSLLTLLGRVMVLWRGKADSALSNPCFMTSPSDFTTFEFPISNYFNFQNFVRSRRDSKEKLPGRVLTPVQLYLTIFLNPPADKKQLFFLLKFFTGLGKIITNMDGSCSKCLRKKIYIQSMKVVDFMQCCYTVGTK